MLYLINIIKIDNAYWANLLHVFSYKLRKLKWDIIYDISFNIQFLSCLFESTNSLLLIGYIDLELKKNQTFFIKVLKLMIHTHLPESCKIIYQVSVQLWFAYVSVSQNTRLKL